MSPRVAMSGVPFFGRTPNRLRFVELLSELPLRFGVRVHAYVLMNNHYHLILETPEANLSRANLSGANLFEADLW